MDKVLKQRLIGASILIALAVIFVPMLFDGPDNDQVSRELDIELPSAPGDRSPIRRLPLNPEQSQATAPTDRDNSTNDLEAPIEPPRIRSDSDRSMPVSSDVPQESEDLREDPARDDPIPREQAEAAPADPVRDEPASSDSQQPPSSPPQEESEAPVQPAASDSSQAGDMERFQVQVGSFGNRENAEELVDQLTRLGHVAEVDIVVRGPSELHRVRTGPYLERGDAERALNQISQTVESVRPVIVGATADAAPNSLTGSGFAVQVGSFASRDNALRLLDQLQNRDYEAFIHRDRAGSRTIWRVRVGPLGTRAEAAQRLQLLIDDAGMDGLVVSHP